MASNAEFITTEYVWAHGRKPQGTGTWFFSPVFWVGEVGSDDLPADGIYRGEGRFSDVKREVSRRFPKVMAWKVMS